jgi:hypothetical protein
LAQQPAYLPLSERAIAIAHTGCPDGGPVTQANDEKGDER